MYEEGKTNILLLDKRRSAELMPGTSDAEDACLLDSCSVPALPPSEPDKISCKHPIAEISAQLSAYMEAVVAVIGFAPMTSWV